MPEINIQINPFMTEALIEMVEKVSSQPDPFFSSMSAGGGEEDTEMRELWVHDLREKQEKDFACLLHVLRHKNFGRRKVSFDEKTAEALLRSCSAVRLMILELYLKNMDPGKLERAEIDLDSLQLPQQRGYACYLFLATLQSIIINELDPGLEQF